MTVFGNETDIIPINKLNYKWTGKHITQNTVKINALINITKKHNYNEK